MLVWIVVLSTLHMNFVKCNLKPKDPLFETYDKTEYNITRMLSSVSPYTMKDQCIPVKAWILTRHATKYPSENILKDIEEVLVQTIIPKLNILYKDENSENFTKLQKNQKIIIKALLDWKNFMSNGSHKDLNEQGKLNIIDLATRLKTKLKKLTSTLEKEEIQILSAKEDRCVITGKILFRNLYEKDQDAIDVVRNTDGDGRLELVKPSDDDVKVINNKTGKADYAEDIFFKNSCTNITKRIGMLLFPQYIEDYETYRNLITHDKTLGKDGRKILPTIQIMYYACAYSFDNLYSDKDTYERHAWCWLFRFEDLQKFEMMQDLEYFYKNGYNENLEDNIKMGNAITEDLLDFLRNPTIIKLKLFIGHTSNCLSVITRFNLFHDAKQITADNIMEMKDRKWKTSFIVPFGCNIMFIVYDCGFKIFDASMYLNEHAIEFTFENGKKCVKCPLDEIEKLLDSFSLQERPKPLSSVDLEKKRLKEANLVKLKEDKKKALVDKIKFDLEKRLETIFDEEEEYTDKLEFATTSI